MENLVTWYKFTFAVCRKRDAQSLECIARVSRGWVLIIDFHMYYLTY